MKNRSLYWLLPVFFLLLAAVFAPGWLLEAREKAVIGKVRKGAMPEFTERVENTMQKLLLIADRYAIEADYGAVDNTVAIALKDILEQEMEELNRLGAFTEMEYNAYKEIIRIGKRRGNAFFSAHQYSIYGGAVEYYVLSVPTEGFSAYIDVETGKVLRLIWGKRGVNLGYDLRTRFGKKPMSIKNLERKNTMLKAWAAYYGVEADYYAEPTEDGRQYADISRAVAGWISDEWEEETVLSVLPIAELRLRDGNMTVSIIGVEYHLKGGEDGFMWTQLLTGDVTEKEGE